MNKSYEIMLNNDDDTNTTNWNVSYKSEVEMMEDQFTKIRIYILVTLIIIGTLGNSLVCLAIYLDRKLQNLTNYFLISLAISDLLYSIISLPVSLFYRYDWHPSTFPLCLLYGTSDNFIAAASTINICLMSLERYLAIRNPLNRRNPTKRTVTIKIGMVWFLAFLQSIPYITAAIRTDVPDQFYVCSDILWTLPYMDVLIYTEAMVLAVTAVVVVVSFILTAILLKELVKKQENAAKLSSGLVRHIGGTISDDKSVHKKSFQVLQSEQKALRVVWLVSFAFIICMVPYICISLYTQFFDGMQMPSVMVTYYISVYLSICNYSVLDPILYTIFNKRFRNNFKNILLCRLKE